MEKTQNNAVTFKCEECGIDDISVELIDFIETIYCENNIYEENEILSIYLCGECVEDFDPFSRIKIQ